MPKLLCCGLSYTAGAWVPALSAQGWRLAASVRSPEKAAAVEGQGITPEPLDATGRLPERALEGVTHLLVSAPPGAQGDPILPSLAEADAGALRSLAWIGYLSTTGVYGDHGGGWVTEETPVSPASERGRRRVQAERGWAAFGLAAGVAVQVFRLPGIYGPGRSQIEALREGTARRIKKPGQFFSRIHVEDIAGALSAAIARPGPGVFNLCDDEPAPPDEVVAYAAGLLGVTAPPEEPFETAQTTLSEMARSFYAESKRVSNAKAKRDLGWCPRYPTYREGLSAIARGT
ncbi:MAG TPA: NAD(P)-dependent oxidoreductase [Alphaproteobacteria bacterium]|nr:NAD(P)-dependent oxidoreductase [Alphaproteobacteria bacterium]